MYELPKNFDPTVFVGLTLELVSFAKYNTYFAFSNDVSINTESQYSYVLDDGEEHLHQHPVTSSKVMNLLEHDVVKTSVDEERITIMFDNNSRLVFLPDPNFESYAIRIGEHEIFV